MAKVEVTSRTVIVQGRVTEAQLAKVDLQTRVLHGFDNLGWRPADIINLQITTEQSDAGDDIYWTAVVLFRLSPQAPIDFRYEGSLF